MAIHVFGINLPIHIWPFWGLLLFCLVSGWAPDASRFIVSRRKDAVRYWFDIGLLAVWVGIITLFFNG